MAKTSAAHHPSRQSAMRISNAGDQTRQRRSQHRLPPKRSVSSLSAKQLERKRANDREAQRLIRQRTKDRIDGLEQEISELRSENERLRRCLKPRSPREADVLHSRHNFEPGNTSWNRSKVMNVSRGRLAPFHETVQSAQETSQETCSPVAPDSFTTSCATAPLDMNSSLYYWGASAACASSDGSVDGVHTQFERALPPPVYPSFVPSYQVQQSSPVTLHCVLPSGQIHVVPPERQVDDVINRKVCNQASWSL
ncbi:hypothetical protein EPUS_05398 [Endocarpon pusillum Z07020]|uniref:BZIP domain-containing protein n=1 Tax=Endocarpon pusillum (strain Z07020 / HMAS-L-300199) TaxID=1263415 RepID=U1GDR0_ENDPU|nr:uncharacterized protein EPUS_05398 [Endocarpon pusillum Z07020]ERF69856.1 hypothetical protein EPUS_05398 [Endocarpon pusillum Z07020]